MNRQTDKVVLVDGHSLLHRAYYALPPLSTADGTPTNAVYGFAMMLLRLIEDERPDVLVVAFDKGKATFRHEAYEAYKAHRPSMPDDLRVQVPLAKELVEALRAASYEVEGYEADDLIGTLARIAEEDAKDVVVVTGDKDALQLVSDNVRALITRRGIKEMDVYDPTAVQEGIGVPPERIADWKGLVGDKSDNIPGVPGIGEKTAARLLGEYESVEKLLEHAGRISGKAGRALAQHAEMALLSKRLATIDRKAPVEVDWEEIRFAGPDVKALYRLYRRLEFRNLLEKLVKAHPELASKTPSTGDAGKGHIGESVLVEVVRGRAALDDLVRRLKGEEALAVEVVFEGDPPYDARPFGISIAASGHAYYVPISRNEEGDEEGGEEGNRTLGKSLELLAPLFEREKTALICRNAKVQEHLLRLLGYSLRGVRDDIMLAGYLLAPGQGDYSLEDLAIKYGEAQPPAVDDLWSGVEDQGDSGRKRTGGKEAASSIADAPVERAAQVFGTRTAMIQRLAAPLAARLRQDGLERLYREIEIPLAHVLAGMERRGIRVDVKRLEQLSEEMKEEMSRLEEEIYRLAGARFNLNSPKQLAEILFEKLELPVIHRTKTGPSTSAEVLEKLAQEHAIAQAILDYRRAQKLKGTYVDALPTLVHPGTGRIHTTFNQTVAATGRLSSANPNLQNIPVRTEAGREVRRAFVAGEGRTLLRADYSQIELRVLAHISGDEALIEAFREDADIHAKTAALIFGVDPKDVTSAQRSAAKAVNFGVVYGISSYGLARGTGLSRAEAQGFIDGYFERYPKVAEYMERVVKEAKERGYVTTLFGRRRYLPDLGSRRFAVRKFAERTAINTPIQGSAADIIKAAMVAVERRVSREGLDAQLLLQVHDELVVEVAPGDLVQAAAALKEEMEGVISLDVPLKVAMEHGPNWLDDEGADT